MDFCEFQAHLVYKVSPGQPRLYREILSQKTRERQKERERKKRKQKLLKL